MEAWSYVGLAVRLGIVSVVVAVAAQQDHIHLRVAHTTHQHRQQSWQPRAQDLTDKKTFNAHLSKDTDFTTIDMKTLILPGLFFTAAWT